MVVLRVSKFGWCVLKELILTDFYFGKEVVLWTVVILKS